MLLRMHMQAWVHVIHEKLRVEPRKPSDRDSWVTVYYFVVAI